MARTHRTTELGVGFWLSAALVVLVLVGFGAFLAFRPGPAPQGSPVVTVTASAPSSAGPATNAGKSSPSPAGTAAGSECSLPGESTDVPAAPPSDVRWEPVGSLAAPTSATAGPQLVDGGLRRCYQHSPTGALLAAINITQGMSSPATALKVVDKQWTPGPGKDNQLASLSEDLSSGDAMLAGFRIPACSLDKCIVALAIASPSASGGVTVPLVWADHDWKVDGSGGALETKPLKSLTGYTPWSPTS